MNKDIKYSGISTVPSDYDCSDGEMASLLNLIPEDGGLKPIQPPKLVLRQEAGAKVLHIHKTSDFLHYIILRKAQTSTSQVVWVAEEGSAPRKLITEDFKVHSVTSLGNTLIMLTDKGMRYWLWKPDKNDYHYLGNHIPELPISFGLQGEMRSTDMFRIDFKPLLGQMKFTPDRKSYISWDEFTDEEKKQVTSQVLAKVNKFIFDNSTNDGKFIYPFLVRYAYRLYDGETLAMHSAPVLMVCSTGCAPIVPYEAIENDGNRYIHARLRVVGMCHTLDYAVLSEQALSVLRNWSDIVKSVDIFVSKPIYTYDQNGQCDRFYNYDEFGESLWGYSICKHTNQKADLSKYPLRYQEKNLGLLYQMTFKPNNLNERHGGVLGLPTKNADTVKEDIRNTSNFFFLQSINLDALTTSRTKIEIPKEYLRSLVNREVMTDDYDSHDTIIPKYAFAYNKRLNVANIDKVLFDGFNTQSVLCFTDGNVLPQFTPSTLADGTVPLTMYIFIRQGGREFIVKPDVGAIGNGASPLFLYYPNRNAYKAIYRRGTQGSFREVRLEPHSFLNGAFYFDGWGDAIQDITGEATPTSDNRVTLQNVVYTSVVDMPFYFPVTGVNSIGTGEVMGICSAVKPLSQGQFGDFPLYAFTTDGVWALKLNADGTYSGRQPVTRDVCINPESITQIDNSVMFVTDRGIMNIAGSQVECISEILSGLSFLDIGALPCIEKIGSSIGLSKSDFDFMNYHDFMKRCSIIYDYRGQRIIAYNPEYIYALVYSLKSHKWGMMTSTIAGGTNAYPDAVAILHNGQIVNFSDKGEGHYRGIVVTRPMKLDNPDVLKTAGTVIQRGQFRNGHVSSVLYASRDLFNWNMVWSSTNHYLRGFSGTPYKYFRVVLLCDLEEDENISGCSVQFVPKLTNRPR